MATYKNAQLIYRHLTGHAAKPCWIAHLRELSGCSMRLAHNRKSINKRVYPCPNDWRRKVLIGVLAELGMLGPKSLVMN